MYKKINLYPKLLRETNQPIDRLNASQSVLKRSKPKQKRNKTTTLFLFQLIGYTKSSLNISLSLIRKCNNVAFLGHIVHVLCLVKDTTVEAKHVLYEIIVVNTNI